MLVIGAILMTGAGLVFAFTRNFLLLIIAGTIGVISPSGNEVGPFLPIEQAALSGVISNRIRTSVFAWYALAGAIATAAGSLFAGIATGLMEKAAKTPLASQRLIILLYAAFGVVLALVFRMLPPSVEWMAKRRRPRARSICSGLEHREAWCFDSAGF
jgi:MFS family permease